ncbi:MAG TPA: radical SAM protein, partial [bacterium]|nr:radical SAM protein [bacterium]
MKILLANPPILLPQKGDEELYFIKAGSRWPHTIFKKRSMASPYLPFPFFLGYAAGLLEADGFEVEVLDSVALNQTPAEFLREAAALSPDLVLIETSTPTIDYDLETAKRLRQQSGCRTALAGPHVTVFAADVLAANPEIDFILLGEYETNFLELARALAAGADPASVGGVAHRRDGVPAVVPSPGLDEPLDRLPHPARHLFPSNRRSDAGAYFDIINRRKPAVQLHSSRGCPFRCSYCLWVNVMYASGRYRMFTPGYVVGEMEEAVERFGAREIYFDDDTFSINRSHVEGILGEIETRGLGVSWSCMADAVGLDGPLLERMARAGCVGVKFGVESAAPAVLAHLEKPVDLGKVREIVKTCFDLGIRTHASFMFGLEGETPETVD